MDPKRNLSDPNAVYLTRPLDKEAELETKAADFLTTAFFCDDDKGNRARVTISITLRDVNDNPPVFQNRLYSMNVSEDTQVGAKIFSRVSVTDADLRSNSRLQIFCNIDPEFRNESQLACETFEARKVFKSPGNYGADIYLKKELDYESYRSITMSLMAKDESESPLNSTVNIVAYIRDAQDTPPRFHSTHYVMHVNENEQIGYVIPFSLKATDGDEGSPRPIRIKIKRDPLGLFRLGQSEPDPAVPRFYFTTVIVNGTIDWESLEGKYVFEVEAVELENGTETNDRVSTNITVDIQDRNDNFPTFDKASYEVFQSESEIGQNNTQVPELTIVVSDDDDASNAIYRVEIVSQTFDTFSIFPDDTTRGKTVVQLRIKNNQYFDYDIPEYRKQVVVLRATDIKSGLGSSATVTVNLLDLNDNKPVFTRDSYVFELSENTPVQTTITRVTATDRDSGANGNVTYSFTGTGREIFTIDPISGVVTLASPLDFENQEKVEVIMLATDQGTDAEETSKSFIVNVLNVNDRPPIPVHDEYKTYAKETTLQLRPPIVVRARDDESAIPNLTYRIVRGNSPNDAFVVNAVSGQLTLVKNLDYDDTPRRQGFFEVIIEVSDNGNPPLTAEIKVVVNVQDENNNTPRFLERRYYGNVSEIADRGSAVVRVSATDDDSGRNGEIRYAIQSGGREHFDILTNSGFIVVSNKSAFDVNVFPMYNMLVYAIDSGSPPRTGSTIVEVKVLDANNQPPRFLTSIYVASIKDDSPVGTPVDVNINATDVDSTADVRYSILLSSVQARSNAGLPIVGDLYRDAFVVDEKDGTIRTNSLLSRDQAESVSFKVVARDLNAERGEQTATTSVLITILGTVLSTIRFIPDRYYFTLTEGLQKGYVITTVLARDPSNPTLRITDYREVDGTDPYNYLAVNRTTGEVTLTRDIDYEDTTSHRISMEIVATAPDGRAARVGVSVEVADDNDNIPYFTKDEYVYRLPEGAQFNFGVGYVQAKDNDSSSFAEIEYSLSGQGSSDFRIAKDGFVTVSDTAVIDYEKTKQYVLLVIASDNPSGRVSTIRLQSSVNLKIEVLDRNDNRPQFEPIPIFYAVETASIGQRVGRIRATDQDSGSNGEVIFSMYDEQDLFRITETGYIVTKNSLREMSALSPFVLTVRAEDKGFPSQFNETTIEIIVRSGQLDDGRPQWSFPRLGEPEYVEEDTPREQFVIQARAMARSDTGLVYYSFSTESNDYRMFKIDRLTGNLTTNGVFDRETQAVYDLILIATDRTNDTLQSLRGLTVRVLDKDDSVPDFRNCPGVSLQVPQTTSVAESTPIGTSVYQVRACDLDEIVNGVVYSPEVINPLCKEEMEDGFFTVTSTGEIITAQTLDRELKQYHLVCVRASPAPARRKRQADGFDRSQMTDVGRIAYVVISLTDINDNGPVFVLDGPREAIATIPAVPNVLRMEAIDPDLAPYNRVRYTIKNIFFHEPGETMVPVPGAFVIGSDTGLLSANFPSYDDFYIPRSYFEVLVQAEDFNNANLNDSTTVYVHIYKPEQTMRVVIDESPDSAREKANEMITALNNLGSRSVFKLQQISYHRVVDDYDVTRTDVCFIVIMNNNVLSVRQGADRLAEPGYEEVLKKYGSTSTGSCYRTRSSLDKIDWAPLWWTLVALAIFIFVCCVILIIAICILFRNYKNYMNTRRTYLVPQ